MVAVKVVRHYVQDEGDGFKVLQRIIARLHQEAITWAGVHHPNIVPLIGVIISPVQALVLPWFNNGNLSNYLARHPAANRFKLISDIARGLEHLHSYTPTIVQADIKPENVLIDDRGGALITDFGTATVLGEDEWYTPSHRYGGTTQWMPREIILGESVRRSRTGDVYSFGGLTCYIMTGRVPHASQSIFQIIRTLNGAKGSPEPIDRWHKHPDLQNHCGRVVAGIIHRCWSQAPEDRPPMPVIVKELSDLNKERESLISLQWD
ncbi:hypothetical protein FRC01_014238 [Tulasnella sp. 417]|nr:hypothetical protein FRC01_014238 [Tulasnella sp. 417]